MEKEMKEKKVSNMERRYHSLLHKSVQLLRPIDLHMCDIFRWEADVEVLVLVFFRHLGVALRFFSYRKLL